MESIDNNNKRRTGRFEVYSTEEIQRKKQESIPTNTKRANDKAARAFRAYLTECQDGGAVDFENFSIAELDRRLEGFWFSARNIKGEKYF